MSSLTSPKATVSASAAKPNSLRREDGDATATTSRGTLTASKAARSDPSSLLASTNLLSLEEASSSAGVSRGSASTSTAAASRAAKGRGGAPTPARSRGTNIATRGATSVRRSSAQVKGGEASVSATPAPTKRTHALMAHCSAFAGGSTSTAFYGCLVPHGEYCETMSCFYANDNSKPCEHVGHHRVVVKEARDGGEEDQEYGLPPYESRNALAAEVKNYDSFSRLQGSVIPLYYGAWPGQRGPAPSYVFEDVGSSLASGRQQLFDLSSEEKRQLETRFAKLLDALHAAQYIHGDIRASNLCVRMTSYSPAAAASIADPSVSTATTQPPAAAHSPSPLPLNTITPSHPAGSFVAVQSQKLLKLTIIDFSYAKSLVGISKAKRLDLFRRDHEALKLVFQELHAGGYY